LDLDVWTAAAAHVAPAAAGDAVAPAGVSTHRYPPPVISGVATACGLNANAPKHNPALAIALMAHRSKLTVTVHSLVTSCNLLRSQFVPGPYDIDVTRVQTGGRMDARKMQMHAMLLLRCVFPVTFDAIPRGNPHAGPSFGYMATEITCET
jgi:hypothetical protein